MIISEINYSKQGTGKEIIVLLHGYLESKEMWYELEPYLLQKYTVICIDLPGHGKTPNFYTEHTMEFMAETVKLVLDKLGVSKFHLIGHSMGGYVSLAFAEKYSQMLNSLVMFHSHVYADDEQKKANRDREIKLVENGNFNKIVEVNIPNMYATHNLSQFNDKIDFSKKIAYATSEKGVIAALNGMKNRKNRLNILKNLKIPVLFLPGKYDNLIPYIENDKQFTASKYITKTTLNSGHMGMFENKEIAFNTISEFLK